MRSLLPWGRDERRHVPTLPQDETFSPFLTLHREMNRLFDDMFTRFETGLPAQTGAGLGWPKIEATEDDKALRITAELPGVDEKDVEVVLDNDVLTIRGEKKSAIEDKDRHYSECYYGRFERLIPLPAAIEEDKLEATFKNGVLSVVLPKAPGQVGRGKRIPINRSEDAKH
jgi:HSP20 family protein